MPGALWVLALVPVVLAISGDGAAVEAEEYSPYADPAKPVLSFLLSDPRNAEDFQKEFGLSGDEMEAVLTATREENEKLAEAYAQSERIVQSSKELPTDQIRSKIASSDYDEEVTAAVAQTKTDIEVLLPQENEASLREWADAAFATERQEFSGESSADYQVTATAPAKLTCRVFATQYRGYTRYEVALPHRALKFNGGFRVRLIRGGYRAQPLVKEVGPWNTYDNYWKAGKYRTMWRNLPRCTPEAQAAYFHNYNRGRDEFGRKVLNPAGVDLTPRVARNLGLKLYQNARIYVRFLWVNR